MASGLLTITSVTNEGGGVYLLGVADSSGVAPNDHLGARRTNATGPGAVYLVTQVPSSTSVRVTDTLTQENGGTFGVPIAGAAWFGTPSAAGLSLIPHTAAPYDAAARRNAYLVGAAGLLAVPVPVASGGTAATTAEDARTNLGLGSMATQAASAVAITGGSITGITDLAVADGGTGASDAPGARTNLGLVIGTNVQAQDSALQAIADATFARGAMIYRGAGGLTNLAAGAQNTLLAMGAQDPAWSTLTAILDAVISSTAGKIVQRGASAWEAADLPSETVEPSLANGRLSVSSSDPIGEGTSATLYYTPFVGNAVALYSGSAWVRRTFTAAGSSFNVAALSADTVYDFYAYDSAGTVTLEAVAWSSSGAGTSTRATALVYQDGVLVKSGDTTRRYLGTIRTVDDSGTKARDASQYRFVWNAQNRTRYADTSSDTTDSWTPSGTNGTWAAINGGNAAWTHRFVSGLASARSARGAHPALVGGATDGYSAAVALNWSSGSPASESARAANSSSGGTMSSHWGGSPAIGYGFVQAVETTSSSGTAPTALGDSGGAAGGFWGCGMIVEGER